MTLVKICGLKKLEDAQFAVENGANLLGMILVPGRSRTIELADAIKISEFVRSLPSSEDFESVNEIKRPQLVGVFMNQPLDEILRLQKEIGLDIVQLHGDEPADYASHIPVPVIKRFTPDAEMTFVGKALDKHTHTIALIDSEQGGQGVKVDWTPLQELSDAGGRYILAGGLTPENVASAALQAGAIGVDVSGGVETNKVKDHAKIRQFIANANRANQN